MARLEVQLDAASRERVLALARHPVLRGGHVTLAFGVERGDFSDSWVPGSAQVGEQVQLRAVAEYHDDRVQALQVEMAGSSTRPQDQGVLHVTVSRTEAGQSKDSNQLLRTGTPEPLALALAGTIAWVD